MKKEEATREAFGRAILQLAEKFPEIVTLDADLSGSLKTKAFAEKFPSRAFNVGISEQDLIGTAAGLAIAGKRPFACSFAIFVTGRGWEQIRNTVCTSSLPVTIVGSHAGILTGEDGETHQALEDVAILRSIENIKIFSPSDGVETFAMVKHILEKEKGPCYLRLGRKKLPYVFTEKEDFSFPKIKTLIKGEKITIFATGPLVNIGIQVAKKLKKENIKPSLINVSCLKPIDEKGIIKELKKTKFCVTLEDHSITGGLGSIIAEIIAENNISSKLKRIGMKSFGESGTPSDLYLKFGLDSESIFQKIKAEF